MKCVACGSTSLVDGDVVDMRGGLMGFFKLKDVPKWKSLFYKGIREVRAYGCVNCLHLQFAVDFSEEDLQGKQPPGKFHTGILDEMQRWLNRMLKRTLKSKNCFS